MRAATMSADLFDLWLQVCQSSLVIAVADRVGESMADLAGDPGAIDATDSVLTSDMLATLRISSRF